MKKTISITIGGLGFDIEEDAYKALASYLEAIERHYAGESMVKDMMDDIEASIAEKLDEKISKRKRAINQDDVSDVIRVIGDPQEIAGGKWKKRKK